MIRKILISLTVLTSLARAEDFSAVGTWSPGSTVFNRFGEMEVKSDSIKWSEESLVKSKVLKSTADSQLFELSKKVDCGKFLRLGPLNGDILEATFFDSKDKAMKAMARTAKSKSPDPLCCSWGVYNR